MPGTLDHLEHIVVVMMSGRSFDHMLGGLKAQDPRIDGLIGVETNPDASGEMIPVQPSRSFKVSSMSIPTIILPVWICRFLVALLQVPIASQTCRVSSKATTLARLMLAAHIESCTTSGRRGCPC